jgi:hypothetical protein
MEIGERNASLDSSPRAGTNASSSSASVLEEHEVEHERDAWTSLWLIFTLIGCLLLAYYVKKFRIYWFPESGGAILVGMVVGGIARLSTDQTQLFEFVRGRSKRPVALFH